MRTLLIVLRSIGLLSAIAIALAGCDADSPRRGLVRGASCGSGTDCESGLCLQVSAARSVCTVLCDSEAEPSTCPALPNWTCAAPNELSKAVCLCQSDSEQEICGDGRDNDCDGVADDCTPDAPECDSDSECDDAIACTDDLCVVGACQHAVVPARCAANEVCDLRKQGCTPGKACADDSDCRDNDPCTTHERCDPPTRVCLWNLLDGDEDGVPPRVCGGTDCNDAERLTYPGAMELCDGTDNGCDGQIDNALPANACAAGQLCMGGSCVCSEGKVECSARCTDLDSDAAHCGGCGRRCPQGAICTSATCGCPNGGLLCEGGGCIDPMSNDQHCGSCPNRCAAGSTCQAGSCVDVDECALELDNCGEHAQCTNTTGGFSCECAAGYIKNSAGTCLDNDECTRGTHDCFSLAACRNREGGFSCSCPPGYTGDGRACENIDECKLYNCSGHGVCSDSPGSFSCLCDTGYVSDGAGACVLQDSCMAGLEPGHKWCSNQCVDIQRSSSHCGDCAAPCGAGGTCEGGQCTCPAGQTFCTGLGCVSVTDDPLHCGSCTKRCGTGGGFCVSNQCFCPTGMQECNGACTSLGTLANCSGCGDRCATGGGCNASRQCTCPTNMQACDGACVNTATSTAHCGMCGHPCPAGATCSGSNCRCPSDKTSVCDNTCVDTAVSPAHCGGCGRPCDVACSVNACATALAVDASDGFSCALLSDGRVRCWGNNVWGQLGNGSEQNSAVPRTVSGLTGVSKLVLGPGYACALTTATALYCWGWNGNFQISNMFVSYYLTPQLVASGYTLVAAGNMHVCAQTSAGAVVCWGENRVGQHGDGTAGEGVGLSGPPTATLSEVSKLVAGETHTCALKQGTVYCWGGNSYGQIGNGTTTNQLTPLAVPGMTEVTDLDAGPNHTCAVRAGAVYCWGFGANGRLGNGTTTSRSTPTPIAPAINNAVSVRTGGAHSCAARADNTILCWGLGSSGQLGHGATTSATSATAMLSDASGLSGLALGGTHNCALKTGGQISCWGSAASNATTFTMNQTSPRQIAW
jgi:alpha-tubulin suppressor-like RCC1 family protein